MDTREMLNRLLKCQHAPGANLDNVFDTLAIDAPLFIGPVSSIVRTVASRRDQTLYEIRMFDPYTHRHLHYMEVPDH